MRRRTWWILIFVVLAAAAAFALTRSSPIPVMVTDVSTGDVRDVVTNTRAGTVEACRRAGLSPSIGGQIARLPVVEGQRVEENEVLAELWNADVRAQLVKAERDAVAADGHRREVCTRAEVADHEAQRLQRLNEQTLASDEATEHAVGEAKALAAACESAKDVARAARAQIDVVEAAIDRTLLRAPFAGVIADINGEIGEYVTPSPVGVATPPTVDLIDDSCLRIRAPIDEVDAPRVRAGQVAEVTLDAFGDRRFEGVVTRVAPYVLEIEKQARTVEIEVEIQDPRSAGLLPGYSADVEVILDERTNVTRIPAQAVVGDSIVFVLDEAAGRLRARRVDIGVSNWEFAEVLDGLTAGELVVLSVDRDGVEDDARAERE